jgi:P4 family phage/plasmid primase-like protien
MTDTNNYQEYFDVDKLNHILNNQEKFKSLMTNKKKDYDPFIICSRFLQNCEIKTYNGSKCGVVKTTYYEKSGRQYATDYLSLQGMPKQIRHTISKDFYKDIDIVNCHPVLLSNLCAKHEIPSPNLNKYIANRDIYIKQLKMDNKKAKSLYLAVMNGGYKDYKDLKNKTRFLQMFKKETDMIRKKIVNLPEHKEGFEKKTKERIGVGETWNHEGSYVSCILNNFENDILTEMSRYYGGESQVLCFDGIMVLKHDTDKSLEGCEKHVFDKLDIKITLTEKPMNKDFDLSNEEIIPYEKPRTIQPLHRNMVIQNDNNDTPEMNLLMSPHTDCDYAEFFTIKYKKNFICIDGDVNQIYFYDSYSQNKVHTWQLGNDSLLYEFLPIQCYNDLKKELNAKFNGYQQAEVYDKYHKSVYTCLRNRSKLKNIVLSIIPKITVNKDIFDLQRNLIGFNNGIYDLHENEFRDGRLEDYVSKSVGYDYKDVSPEKVDFLNKFIDKIMPVPEERDILLKALSSGLYGQTVQRFFILTGEGSNGKDTLVSKLFKWTTGRDYFEYSNTTILTEKRKGDLCQGMANLHKKRTAVWNEPPKQSILQGGPIKELTGSSEINARGLYSKNTSTQLQETCFMLCNDIPRIDNVDGGVARRIVVIPFRSLFRKQEDIDKMSNTENVYKEDRYYDSDEFRDSYKLTLFHILTKYFNMWKSDSFMFTNIPNSIQELSNQYLQDSDDFITWFNEIFEYSESKDDFIQIKDIYTHFQNSDLYNNMSKRERRLNNKKKVEETIRRHPKLRGFCKDEHQPYINGKQQKYRSVLLNHKPIYETPDDYVMAP